MKVNIKTRYLPTSGKVQPDEGRLEIFAMNGALLAFVKFDPSSTDDYRDAVREAIELCEKREVYIERIDDQLPYSFLINTFSV